MLKIYVKLCDCEELYNLNDIRQAPRRIAGFCFFIRRKCQRNSCTVTSSAADGEGTADLLMVKLFPKTTSKNGYCRTIFLLFHLDDIRLIARDSTAVYFSQPMR
jgi:hypothetical protein